MGEVLKGVLQYIKKVFKVIGIIILILIIVYILYEFNNDKLKRERIQLEDKIIVSVNYDLSECDKNFPLLVTISNNSNQVVNFIEYDILIHRKGYSTEISYSSYKYDKRIKYSSDKILMPGMVHTQCWKYFVNEEYEKYNSPVNLNFEIGKQKYIHFQLKRS